MQQNLATQQPEICAQARTYLFAWQDEMLASMPAGYTVDPLRTVLAEGGPFHARGNLRRYLQRLRETGRANQAALLEEGHPGEF